MLPETVKSVIWSMIHRVPYGRAFHESQSTQTPIPLQAILRQRVLRRSSGVYWPIHSSSLVQHPERIWIGVETSPGLMPGCYIQGAGGICVGDYTQVAPNVGLISSNHDIYDSRVSIPGAIRIGPYCWLGMGAIVLAGVVLGPHTVVAAGAVVTRSFPDGYAVIGGVPAVEMKHLERSRCVRHASAHRYHGFVPAEEFEAFARGFLSPETLALAAAG